MAIVEFTTMCMILDNSTNRVVVQERVKSWPGISFPGGHVEEGEGILDATIREVKEETGLEISQLQPCGIIHWYNTQTSERYMVFNFKTEVWSGDLLQETEEGKVFWAEIAELPKLNLAEGFGERLPMFLEDKYVEGFATYSEHGHNEMKFR